jgi:hypothetical protein
MSFFIPPLDVEEEKEEKEEGYKYHQVDTRRWTEDNSIYHKPYKINPNLVREWSIDEKGDLRVGPDELIKFPPMFVTTYVHGSIDNGWFRILLDPNEFNRLMENYP